MRLWNNNNGTFVEMAVDAGIADTGSGKGLLTFDYDNDGDLDVFVVNNGDSPVLFRNDGGNANHWLRVKTVGQESNREGLGAWITVTPELGGPSQVWQVNGGSNFLGQDDVIAHFGLGDHLGRIHQVTIEWPSGQFQQFFDVRRDHLLVAVEPAWLPEPAGGLMLITMITAAGLRRRRRR